MYVRIIAYRTEMSIVNFWLAGILPPKNFEKECYG